MEHKIFLDMDGVLSDFVKGFEKKVGITPIAFKHEYDEKYGSHQKHFWETIVKIPNFWYDIPMCKEAKELVKYLSKYDLKIISAIPSKIGKRKAKREKKKWIKKHLGKHKIIFTELSTKNYMNGKKEKHCKGTLDYVLIDDSAENVKRWRAKGGLAILHFSANHTISVLQKLGI